MPIYQVSNRDLKEVAQTIVGAEGILERQDLQHLRLDTAMCQRIAQLAYLGEQEWKKQDFSIETKTAMSPGCERIRMATL